MSRRWTGTMIMTMTTTRVGRSTNYVRPTRAPARAADTPAPPAAQGIWSRGRAGRSGSAPRRSVRPRRPPPQRARHLRQCGPGYNRRLQPSLSPALISADGRRLYEHICSDVIGHARVTQLRAHGQKLLGHQPAAPAELGITVTALRTQTAYRPPVCRPLRAALEQAGRAGVSP